MNGEATTNDSPPLLLHAFATFAVGGAQMRFVTLANAFGDGFRHIVVAMDGNHDCARLLSRAVDLRCEPLEAPKHATLGNARRFRGLLRKFTPDLLVTYNWGAIEWAMANIPRLVRHIHVEDGFGPEERNAQIRRRVLTRRLVLARSTVVLPSRNLQGIATNIWHLDRRRVHYIPNGIDLDRFAAGKRAPTGEPAIGTITGLRREKNLTRLLHAFRQVTDTTPARLIIVGDGPERSMLEAQAAGLGLGQRVQFTGHLDDPAPLYRSIDVFTLSSDTEQMPLSVLEAMAAGLPVAATDVGDIASMVAAENRPFITSLDETALAKAIKSLVRDPALRQRVGAANRAKAVAEFGQVGMIAAWRTLFDGYCDGGMTEITLSRVTDWTDLGQRWRALEERSNCSFFQSWTWTGCRAEERFPDPVLLEATSDGRVVVMALFNRRRTMTGQQTLWLGESGRRDFDAIYIEWNGLLVETGTPARLLADCLRAARRGPLNGWRPWVGRRLMLSGVDEPTMQAAQTADGHLEMLRQSSAPYVDLAALRHKQQTYLAALSGNTRYQLRRSARAYAATGELELRRAASLDEAMAYLNALAVLHQTTWTRRGRPGAFADPWIGSFHRTLVQRGLERGEIALLQLAAGERVVGYLYNLEFRGSVVNYQSGFDYQGAERHQKPGLTSHHHAIIDAASRGFARYDFLAGDDRYKRSLGTAEAKLGWLEVGGGWPSRLLARWAR